VKYALKKSQFNILLKQNVHKMIVALIKIFIYLLYIHIYTHTHTHTHTHIQVIIQSYCSM